jgi:hypothetical protein
MSWILGNKPPGWGCAALPLATAIAVCFSVSQTAFAQTHSGDAAMAQTLFDEGKRKMATGDYAHACPQLAESYRLDPGSGTLTALAVCHESLGKTASAWTEFIQLISEARQAGRTDRERFAQRHISVIEPNLSRLAVVVEPAIAGLPGFEVRRDGTILGQAGWGTAAPVDPGEHLVEARAAGKIPWSITVAIGPVQDIQTITIGMLEDLPDVTPEPQPERVRRRVEGPPLPVRDIPLEEGQPPSSALGASRSVSSTSPPIAIDVTSTRDHHAALTGTGQRSIGLLVGGFGLVAAGVGMYFGPRAISESNQAKGLCPNRNACANPDAVSVNDDARSSALAADVALGVSIAALAGGAILYFTAPSARPHMAPTVAIHVVPIASPVGGRFVMDARW